MPLSTDISAGQSGHVDAHRKLHRRFNDGVSVTDYGAARDSETDDTAAIRAAVEVARVNGGRVLLPAGKYAIGELSLDDLSGIEICGEGNRANSARGTTLIYSGKDTALKLGKSGYAQRQSGLCNLTILNAGDGQVGVELNGWKQSMVRDITVQGFPTGLVASESSTLSSFWRVRAVNAATLGFHIDEGCNGTALYSCTAYDCQEGFRIGAANSGIALFHSLIDVNATLDGVTGIKVIADALPSIYGGRIEVSGDSVASDARGVVIDGVNVRVFISGLYINMNDNPRAKGIVVNDGVAATLLSNHVRSADVGIDLSIDPAFVTRIGNTFANCITDVQEP